MKINTNSFFLFIICITSVVFSGCSDDIKIDDPAPTAGTVYFVFKNEVDGQPIETGMLNYTNDAGNVYSVTMLKYYISNLTFINNNGTEFKAPNYELVNIDSANSKTFAVILPFGDYNKLRFFMGVDSIKNFSGAQSGELDPVYGMLWDWSTGYLFFKHEGEFIDSTGIVQPLSYHYGTIGGLITHELNMTLPVSTTPKIVTITFNLNKIYRSPNVVDLNGNNIHSGVPGWIQTMKENFPGSFELTGIQ